jgi:hypothetical protein
MNPDIGDPCLNYVLNILNSLASVTIRVLQRGHSRELAMISSEQALHIAR